VPLIERGAFAFFVPTLGIAVVLSPFFILQRHPLALAPLKKEDNTKIFTGLKEHPEFDSRAFPAIS
jgi:hypothetical protein